MTLFLEPVCVFQTADESEQVDGRLEAWNPVQGDAELNCVCVIDRGQTAVSRGSFSGLTHPSVAVSRSELPRCGLAVTTQHQRVCQCVLTPTSVSHHQQRLRSDQSMLKAFKHTVSSPLINIYNYLRNTRLSLNQHLCNCGSRQ